MDINLYETGEGADYVVLENDIQLSNALWLPVYLALFGGNVAQTTDSVSEDFLQRFDYWGNTLLESFPEAQYNSEFERSLNETALNTGNIVLLEGIAKRDLRFLSGLGEINVDISLIRVDAIEINIDLIEPESDAVNIFSFVWDATRTERIVNREVGKVIIEEPEGEGIMYNGDSILYNGDIITYNE